LEAPLTCACAGWCRGSTERGDATGAAWTAIERVRRAEQQPAAEPDLRDIKRLSPRAPPRRPGFRIGLVLILAILLIFGLHRLVTTFHAPPERNARASQRAAQPVGEAIIGTGDIRLVVDALGTVTPLATVTVKTQINGQLTEVGFTEASWSRRATF